ncbi:hypothetical protein Lser_V15G12054 [Lactuca serriola]
MAKPFFLFFLLIICLLSSTSESRRPPPFLSKSPRLLKTQNILVQPKYTYETRYFDQTLDHFRFNDLPKFQQRYLINSDHWVGPGPNRLGPIFLYCGNKGDIEWFATGTGFVWELTPRFGAMVIFPEIMVNRCHMEARKEAYKNASTLAYLTAEQALADYALLITDLKRNLSAEASLVILFGGSYGGSKIFSNNFNKN